MRGGFPVNYATMSLLTAWEEVFLSSENSGTGG